jgi:hypothetical protein
MYKKKCQVHSPNIPNNKKGYGSIYPVHIMTNKEICQRLLDMIIWVSAVLIFFSIYIIH